MARDTARAFSALKVLEVVQADKRAIEKRELAAVREARAGGASWTYIATVLGIARQNAHRKYAHLV